MHYLAIHAFVSFAYLLILGVTWWFASLINASLAPTSKHKAARNHARQMTSDLLKGTSMGIITLGVLEPLLKEAPDTATIGALAQIADSLNLPYREFAAFTVLIAKLAAAALAASVVHSMALKVASYVED